MHQALPAAERHPSESSPAPALPPSSARWSRGLLAFVRTLIIALAFAAPFIYLPFTADGLFAKVVVVEIAAVIAAAAWLANVLITKRIAYKRAPLNAALLALAVVMMLATAASAAPWSSFWGADATGEKAASVLAFIVLGFLASSALRPEDVRRLARALMLAGFLLGLFAIGSVIAARTGFQLPAWLAVNPIGTLNAFALALAAGFVFSLTFALTSGKSDKRMRALAGAASLLLFGALLALGFSMAWAGIAAAMTILLTFNFTKIWREDPGSAAGAGGPSSPPAYTLGGSGAAIAFLVLIVALFGAFRPIPFAARIVATPIEISPSLRSTLAVGWEALKTEPVLGFGPANFRLAFNRFRDPSLNATIFWQTRFNHGFSLAGTLPATTGAAGAIAFVAFAVMAVATIGRAVWRAESSDPYRWAFALAAVFVIAAWFLYAGNFTVSLIGFLALGALTALTNEARRSEPASPARLPARRAGGPDGHAGGDPGARPERPSRWRISRRVVLVEAPAMNFVTSLVVVFASAFSLVAIYALASSYAAEVVFTTARRSLDQSGDLEATRTLINRAVGLNSNEEAYHQGLVQISLLTVNRLIAEAANAAGADLSARFRQEVSSGIASANAATALSPANPASWTLLGRLYETVIPFVPGADRASAEAYARAVENDPYDPTIRLARGRAALATADVVSFQASQSQGEARAQLDALHKEALGQAREDTEEAVKLKSDLADAQFLLAQVLLRQGNTVEAVSRVEQTAALAPGDIGVAFQLGVLYYRSDDLERAAREFRRAIALNDNYSNARYFLGLIYDRRGDRDGALSQFQKIIALNPDNGEVKAIIANIQARRPALAGISPPGTPPEARREAPVRESAGEVPLRGR